MIFTIFPCPLCHHQLLSTSPILIVISVILMLLEILLLIIIITIIIISIIIISLLLVITIIIIISCRPSCLLRKSCYKLRREPTQPIGTRSLSLHLWQSSFLLLMRCNGLVNNYGDFHNIIIAA